MREDRRSTPIAGRGLARRALGACALAGGLSLSACVNYVHLPLQPSPDECRAANDALGDHPADVKLPSGYTIHRDKAGVVRVDPDGVSSTIDGSRLAWSSVASISTVRRSHSASVGAVWGGVLGFGATFLTTFAVESNQCSGQYTLCHDALLNGIGAALVGTAGALAGALVGLVAGSVTGEGTVVDRQRP